MSDPDKRSSSSGKDNLFQCEYLAISYDEFDVLVSDINEKVLEAIGETYEIEHLSAGTVPSPAFPISGKIHGPNMRFMVCLVCQLSGKPNSKAINVWFLIDTGSPFTCLTMKSLEAFFGQGNVADDPNKMYLMTIQDQKNEILCRISKEHFKEVNILGANAMRQLNISSIDQINWDNHTFRLSNQ